MDKAFDLTVSTPKKTLYKGMVCSAMIPGESGYFGVLADHAPLIANTIRGTITIKDSAGKLARIPIAFSGFFHVQRNIAVVLVNND